MTRKLVLGYHDDSIPLFQAPDITLYRGECAALIGPNGAGKSTFLKTVLGELEPLSGESRLGASVKIGYFAQAHEKLNHDNTILDEIFSVQHMPISEARSYMARYLFTGDDFEKPVSVLSGGERGRLALAKLALAGANLLLLDEPTNHLDIPSQEILEMVLSEFEGTILLVSHDRYLIRNLATQIWALHVPRKASEGPTELVVHEGPYEEYLALRDSNAAPELASKKASLARPHPQAHRSQKVMSEFERNKRLVQLEDEVNRLEIELVNLSGALEAASSAAKLEEVSRLGKAYADAERRLDSLIQEWEMLAAGLT